MSCRLSLCRENCLAIQTVRGNAAYRRGFFTGGRNDEHAPSSFSATCVRLYHCCPHDGLHAPTNENCASTAARTEAWGGYRGTAKTPAAFAGTNSAGASGSRRSFRLESRPLPLELHGIGERAGTGLLLVARSLRRTTLSNVGVDQRKLDVARRLVGMDAGVLAIAVLVDRHGYLALVTGQPRPRFGARGAGIEGGGGANAFAKTAMLWTFAEIA
jgi:hypothetical protein